jgi:hypothetical protein
MRVFQQFMYLSLFQKRSQKTVKNTWTFTGSLFIPEQSLIIILNSTFENMAETCVPLLLANWTNVSSYSSLPYLC